MTEPMPPGEAQFVDRRPGPVVLHDGVVVPGALCADVAILLDLLDSFLRTSRPLPNGRTVRLPRAKQVLQDAFRSAAVDYQERQARTAAFAAVTAHRGVVLATPQAVTPSGPEITTATAALILDRTEARVRQLAAAGYIAGRKAERNVWMIDRASVLAYASRGSTRHDDSGTGHHRAAERGAA